MAKQYYGAHKSEGFWRGRLYTWSEDGNRELTRYLTPELYDTPDEAIDAIADYMDEHDIDAEAE